MLFKEGNDLVVQVIEASNAVRHPFRVIPANHAAPKEFLKCMKQLDIALMLNNREFREHLESGSHFWVRIDCDEKTAFAVRESYNPVSFQVSWMRLNVKSLRVLHGLEPSLRIVPLSDQILTAAT